METCTEGSNPFLSAITRFSLMKYKILIFTATYNEAGNIINFLDKIFSLKEELDILIVDDNSPDLTWSLIEKYKNRNQKKIELIKRPNKQGLDTAHKLAFTYAKERKYDILITLDADLSHNPLIIPEFLEKLKYNPFVIGSRYVAGGKNEMRLRRYLLSFIGNKVIKLILNIDIDEFTSSYRGFNLKLLKNFDLNEVSLKGYSFFMGTINLLHITENNIKQIPIKFSDRATGKSKIPKTEIFRTLINLFLIKFNFIKR